MTATDVVLIQWRPDREATVLSELEGIFHGNQCKEQRRGRVFSLFSRLTDVIYQLDRLIALSRRSSGRLKLAQEKTDDGLSSHLPILFKYSLFQTFSGSSSSRWFCDINHFTQQDPSGPSGQALMGFKGEKKCSWLPQHVERCCIMTEGNMQRTNDVLRPDKQSQNSVVT